MVYEPVVIEERLVATFEGIDEYIEDFWRPQFFKPQSPDIQALVVLFEEYDLPPVDTNGEDISIVAPVEESPAR